MSHDTGIIVRELTEEDWPDVAAIYREGIATGIATLDSEPPTYEEFDRKNHTFCRLAASIQNQVAGWVAIAPVSYRYAYRGVAEISIYISERYKKKGVGSTLMHHLIACCESHHIWTLQAVIFPENKASLQLHRNFGFRIVGYREKIARNNRNQWQDTILLERRSSFIK